MEDEIVKQARKEVSLFYKKRCKWNIYFIIFTTILNLIFYFIFNASLGLTIFFITLWLLIGFLDLRRNYKDYLNYKD